MRRETVRERERGERGCWHRPCYDSPTYPRQPSHEAPHRETRSSLKPYPPRETNRRNQRHAKTVLHPSYVYTNRSIINSIVTTHAKERDRERKKKRGANIKYQTSLQTGSPTQAKSEQKGGVRGVKVNKRDIKGRCGKKKRKKNIYYQYLLIR